MESAEQDLTGKRICKICQMPLADGDHGNRKAHLNCAYQEKKMRQKEKYEVGNSAKLQIQKNEAVTARLYKLDQKKQGISHLEAMEQGFKFKCPSTKRKHLNMIINMFDKYGYSLETIENEILIFFYHESDLN
jgi:hypothetical protein